MTKRELDQAVEGLYHNLNTLQSRSGNQLPFTSINYGTCTLIEGRMVIRSLLEGSIKGIGKLIKSAVSILELVPVETVISKCIYETDNKELYNILLYLIRENCKDEKIIKELEKFDYFKC